MTGIDPRTALALLALIGCAPTPLQLDAERDQGLQERVTALSLTVAGTPTPGSVLTYTLTGANAGETVVFARAGGTGPGLCPPPLGGLCLDLDPGSTKLLGNAVADAAGTAVITMTLPATVSAGALLSVQGVAARGVGGVDSVKSDVADITVSSLTDADGDGADAAVDCDDLDPTVYPGADELCDGVDTDCDPATGEDGVVTASGVAYSSVADAVNFAAPGAVISICPGTYLETVVLTRDVTLLGTGGAAVTVLDADGALDRVIDIDGAAQVHIEGLTLTGSADGGLRATGDLQLTVVDTVVTDNADAFGGGLYLDAGLTSTSSVTLVRIEVSNNEATATGGGIYGGGAGSLTLDQVTLTDNVADWAAGLYVGSTMGPTVVDDCVIEGNDASVQGGGIYLTTNTVDVISTDFGVGATENLPDDVYGYFGSSNTYDYTFFHDDETFTCDDLGCL